VVACGSYSVGPYPLPVNGSLGQRTSLIHRHKSRAIQIQKGLQLCMQLWEVVGSSCFSAGLACAVRGCLGSPPVWPRRAGPCLFSLSTRSASGSLAKEKARVMAFSHPPSFQRGGHGRTGTAICIVLHLMYGMAAHQAMNFCLCRRLAISYPQKHGNRSNSQ
jgi:hypothetical protein